MPPETHHVLEDLLARRWTRVVLGWITASDSASRCLFERLAENYNNPALLGWSRWKWRLPEPAIDMALTPSQREWLLKKLVFYLQEGRINVISTAPQFMRACVQYAPQDGILLSDRTDRGGHCAQCAYGAYCGGCRARAHFYTGDLRAGDPGCHYNRSLWDDLDRRLNGALPVLVESPGNRTAIGPRADVSSTSCG
jgi:hypothetical protein